MRISAILAVSALVAATNAQAAPVVEGISSTTVQQSGRIELTGAGFGAAGRVEIGGIETASAHWSDGRITAYVSEGVPLGSTTLQVITGDGASAPLPIDVQPLPAGTGGVAWTFAGEGSWVTHRPGTAPDGTLFVSDDAGFIYAIAPSGVVRWIRHAPTVGGQIGLPDPDIVPVGADRGPVAVGADAIYVAVELETELQIQAWSFDGLLQWTYAMPRPGPLPERRVAGRHDSQYMTFSHGPAVGPDGNVYFVVRGKQGLHVLRPDGTLLWNEPQELSHPMDVNTYVGADITFGRSRPDGPIDQAYVVTEVTPPLLTTGFQGLYAFHLGGGPAWVVKAVWQLDGYEPWSLRQYHASVAPDGTLYLSGSRTVSYYNDRNGVHVYEPTIGERLGQYFPSPEGSHFVDISEAEAAPDGGAYVLSAHAELHAFSAARERRWKTTLGSGVERRIEHGPVVHPSGEAVIATGVDSGRAWLWSASAADGAVELEVELPAVDGVHGVPTTRVQFDPAGNHAFVATWLPGTDRWAVHAVDTPASGAPGGGTGGTGGTGGGGSAGGEGGDGAGGEGGDGAGGAGGGGDGAGGVGGTGATGGSSAAPPPGESTATPPSGCGAAAGAPGAISLALGLAALVRRTRRP